MEASSGADVWTVQRLLAWTRGYFERAGLDQPRLCAELLLAHALGCRKIDLYTRFDAVPTEQQRARFRELIRAAAKGTPIAYLIGRKEFYSLEFEVTPAVLIPRPETELLVERVISFCRRQDRPSWNILDVGTGSGCIAIAVAKYVQQARFVATDISAEALQVAGRNVARHGLADRIRLVCCDGLALPADAVPAGGFDVIVCNPPYIAEDRWAELPPAVRDYEPRQALAGGPDGLDFFRRLSEGAPALLQPGGTVFVEVGYDQHEHVTAIFSAGGRFRRRGAWQDAGGVYVRVLQFERAAGQDLPAQGPRLALQKDAELPDGCGDIR